MDKNSSTPTISTRRNTCRRHGPFVEIISKAYAVVVTGETQRCQRERSHHGVKDTHSPRNSKYHCSKSSELELWKTLRFGSEVLCIRGVLSCTDIPLSALPLWGTPSRGLFPWLLVRVCPPIPAGVPSRPSFYCRGVFTCSPLWQDFGPTVFFPPPRILGYQKSILSCSIVFWCFELYTLFKEFWEPPF